ncbi:MAG TPA: LuxR C-terminal-related transcriptional regulator [Acidimicrobiales bacterium]|nr:LuxR C-terminal-related transcriptional regulator [Acidimicrobiales bacterium]
MDEPTPSGAVPGWDWARVGEVIEAIAAVEDPVDFGMVALRALDSVVGFDLGSFNEIDPDVPLAVFCSYPDDDAGPPAGDLEGFSHLVQQNPILQHQQETGDGSSRRLSDFLSQGELHRLELYQRVYGPLGVEFQVAVGLTAKAPLIIAFALNRKRIDFTDVELSLLDMLRPHLIQGYRNVQAVAALRSIDGALAEVGKAVIVLGTHGVAGDAPPWALQVIEEHFGDRSGAALPEPVWTWVEEERQSGFGDGQPRIHRPLTSIIGDRQLVVRFVPGVPGRADVLVLDEREPQRGSADLRRLGLTAREADLLWLLTRGEATVEIAAQLGVTVGTVNKHLQNIFRKLGVTSRTGAVATASDALFSFR